MPLSFCCDDVQVSSTSGLWVSRALSERILYHSVNAPKPQLAEWLADAVSLITARCALDQGREVMAVPGHPLDTRSSGCNLLLRDGAAMVRSAADILETLGMTPTRPVPNAALAQDHPRHQTPRTQTQASPPAAPHSGGVEGLILSHLGASPIAKDQLTRDLAQTPREIAQALAILEMAGQVNRSAGGMVSRSR